MVSVASMVPAALSCCSSFKHTPQHLIRIQLNKITLINFHYFSGMNLCNLNPLLFISPPGLLIEQQGTWLYCLDMNCSDLIELARVVMHSNVGA